MQNRLPAFLNKCRVCIICEGDEEYDYLDRLIPVHLPAPKRFLVIEEKVPISK